MRPSETAAVPSTMPGFVRHENGPITPLERFAMDRSSSSFHALAGAAGGFTSGVVTCPLDVIKTKLQAQGAFRAQQTSGPARVVYSGMLGTARMIWREDGLKGMYRGLGPLIFGYLPTWAVWFPVYSASKEYLSTYNGDSPNLVSVVSSVVAGACSSMVTNPIWVIKTRLMSQWSREAAHNDGRQGPHWGHYRSTFDAAKKMYRTEGLLSFYSGLTPALLGLTHVAIQFPAYEYLKREFTGHGMGVSVEGDDTSQWMGILSASVLSKIMASTATFPHEVIRTRLQTQQRSMPSASGLEGSEYHGPASAHAKTRVVTPKYNGILQTFKTILRDEGWRAFYAGMGTSIMRTVPAAATTLLTYEYVKKQLEHAKSEGERKTADSW